MTYISSVGSTASTLPPGGATADAGGIAAGAMAEIGQRILAWVGAIGGRPQAGSDRPETTGGFAPDTAELARGGDVYGLSALSQDIGARLSAGPVEQGALDRAIGDFARAAVVQVAGLAGAGTATQFGGLSTMLDASTSAGSAGVDGVISRLETAAAALTARNG